MHLDPYLLRLGPLGIRWYGVFMAISMAIGIRYFVRRGRQAGVDEDTLYNMALLSILAGVAGARLVYVLTNWHYFQLHPAQILQIEQGGLAIHGAIVGGVAIGMWYAWIRRLPFWALVDGMVPGICVGVFLVRIGNIFNGEILGHAAVLLGGHRQPAQVYEMVFALILWAVYWRQLRRDPADGVPFWTFMLGYSILRFMSEAFRDNPQYGMHYTNHYLGIGFATLEQWFTPLILALTLWALAWRRGVDRHTFTEGPRWSPGPAGMAAVPQGSGEGA